MDKDVTTDHDLYCQHNEFDKRLFIRTVFIVLAWIILYSYI
jgi:hypothetical protein